MKILVDGQTYSTADINRGIGTYLVNMLRNIALISPLTEIVLAVYDDSDKSCMRSLPPYIKTVSLGKKLTVDETSHKEYCGRIDEIVKDESIDIFWIPNYLMLNVNSIDRKPLCKVAITVYDLIPLVFKAEYMDEWPREVSTEYARRISRIDGISDLIISISEATKKDLIENTRVAVQKVKTTYLGFKRSLKGAYGKDRIREKYGTEDYILYVGGFDPRKNMDRSALAFKRLIEKYSHDGLSYIIACACDERSRERFTKLLKDNGLEHRVILTGFVQDEELAGLYAHARAFFFPSMYEGFGLPLLEAMALGAPVAASDTSSIPEVVGDAGLLFDPLDVDDMADKLNELLSGNGRTEKLSQNGSLRVKRFSWEDSAGGLIDELESLYLKIDGRKPRIAYFSPVSPQKTGISMYAEELLPHLLNYASVDLFLDTGVSPENDFVRGNVKYYPYSAFETRLKSEKYDAIIYNMGNNTIHRYVYDMLRKYPGITILHDYVLHPFIQYITVLDGDPDTYVREMADAYGDEGKRIALDYIRRKDCYIDYLKYPLNECIVKSSKMVLVHSQYARALLSGYSNVKVIPEGIGMKDTGLEKIAIRKELGLGDAGIILGCFGFMNQNKRINVLLSVFKQLSAQIPQIILLLVGDIDKSYKKDILKFISENDLEGKVIVTGRCSDELYDKYMSCTDIVVNLRYPTMGETSRTLLEAMSMGKPSIVTDAGSYKDFSNNCCWKVEADAFEKDLLEAYLLELVGDKKLRESMGRNAREYVYKNHRWEKVVIEYIKNIQGTIGEP